MNKIFRPLLLITLFLTVFLVGACQKTAENEHLPEYCQTYSGFTSFASKDFYDLLRESGHDLDRVSYFQVISEITLEFEVDDPNRDIDLSGIQCFQNLTNLTLVGQSFKDLSPISALSNIQSITLRGTSVVSIDSFKNLSKIKSLEISDTRTLQSVDGVEEMTKLTVLDLSNNGIVNIDGLNNLTNLTKLYLNDNEIRVFPSINQLDQLEILDISDNDIYALGEDLSGLRALKTLYAQNNEICDLSTLDDLTSLVTLNLSTNDLGCLGEGVSPVFDALENAPNLTSLYLDNNDLTSIDGLRGRDINLQTLHINDNRLTDITPISAYTNITELVIYNNNISEIDDLSGMTGLTAIDLSGNEITDFSDLLSIESLETVNLSFNEITEIPPMSTSWPNLSSLDLSSNALDVTSGIKGHPSIEELILFDNDLRVLSGISDLPELDTLVIFDDIENPENPTPEDPDIYVNPNRIEEINDSFYNVDSLVLHDFNTLDIGFELEDGLVIVNSFNDINEITTVNLTGMGIDSIDANSFNLPNLSALRVGENNLTDISFILGSPSLEQLTVSDNPITNLDVISGLGTSDLDNLTLVRAENIPANNAMTNAFIELPNLERIYLNNTSITSLDNCFNDLGSLEVIEFDPADLTKIVDSFNDLYDTYTSSNQFDFDTGKIGEIRGSFNGGNYDFLSISNQNTTLFTTVIDDSFNNLSVQGLGLYIFDSEFETISNSFKNVTTANLALSSNRIETITDSFNGTTVDSVLSLAGNQLQTVPSLNTLTSVDQINLNTNLLTTLDFLVSINDITALDVSNQANPLTSSYTLASIDGINDMPTLTTLIIDSVGVTSITGMRNIGITEFVFDKSFNDNIVIHTVDPDAFTGTDLTVLDLGNHEIDNVAFLLNFENLENLSIGIDSADLSGFQGIDMAASLTALSIDSKQAISDYSYLSAYDLVVDLEVLSTSYDTIENLDGLANLENLIMNFGIINHISNSFNDIGDFNSGNYIDSFSSLDTITNSFDIYGLPLYTNNVTLDGDTVITDSFHNVSTIYLQGNNGDLVPNFDVDSFTNMTNLAMDFGQYTNYNFLNGYSGLEQLTITNLASPITDLSNTNITSFVIASGATSISALDITISPTGEIEYTTSRNGSLDITSNANILDIDAGNASVTMNSSATTLRVRGLMIDVTINSASLTTLELEGYTTSTTEVNGTNLATISRISTIEVNASTFTVNSDVPTLNYNVRATNLIVNNNTATNLDLTISGGDITLNNTQNTLTIDVNATDFYYNNNSLQDITITGSVGIVSISSDSLSSVNVGSTSITEMILSSNATSVTVNGTNTTQTSLTNANITSFTTNMGNNDIELITSNNQPLTINGVAGELTLTGVSVPSVVFDNASNIADFTVPASSNMNSLTFGDSAVDNISLTTTQTALTVTGSHNMTFDLYSGSFSSLDLNTPASNYTFNSSGATVTADLSVNDIAFTGTNLAVLNIVALSSIGDLDINASTVFTTLNSNDATISILTINTTVGSLSIDAVNTSLTTVNNNSITSLTADVGTNSMQLASTNAADLTLDITSANATIITSTDDLTVNATSNITLFQLGASALATFDSSTATIGTMIVNDSSTSLTITGSGISTLDINDTIITLNLNLDVNTAVDVSTSSSIDVTTTTSGITLSSVGNSSINGGSVLEDVTFNVGVGNLDITANKASLNLSIDGVGNVVTVTGADITGLTVAPTTDITELNLNNLNIASLDISSATIEELIYATSLASVTIVGDTSLITEINALSLNSLDITASSVQVTTNQGTLDLDGNVTTTTIIGNNLVSMNLADYTTSNLDLTASSMNVLDTGTSVSNSVVIGTGEATFVLTTSVPTVEVIGETTGTLNITAPNMQTLTTNVNNLVMDTDYATLVVTADNLNDLSGTVNGLSVTTSDTGTFNMDITATSGITINGANITTLDIAGTSNLVDVTFNTASLGSLDTNNATISNPIDVSLNSSTASFITDSSSSIIVNYGGIGTFTYTFNTTGAPELSFTNVTINATTATGMDIDGQMQNITINGGNIAVGDTTGLFVTNKMTVNNSSLTDLTFVHADLLTELIELEINTIDTGDIDNVLTTLATTSVNLISPIENQDIYDHFYNEKSTELTDQEVIDNARFDGFKTTAVNDAWAEILTNQYMDHLDETNTKGEIDSQTYQSVDDYYQSYLTNDGVDEGTLTAQQIQDIQDAIQATLDDPLLTILDTTINQQVSDSIDTESASYATTEQGNITFTLNA